MSKIESLITGNLAKDTEHGGGRMNSNPDFADLVDQYKELHAKGLTWTDGARLLFLEMLEYGPPEYRKLVEVILDDMGLTLESDGCTEDGQPTTSLAAVARLHGISLEEAHQLLIQFRAERALLGLSNDWTHPAFIVLIKAFGYLFIFLGGQVHGENQGAPNP